MLIHYDNLHRHGIVKDILPQELPQGAWSDGKNVRFVDGAVEKFTGHDEIYATAVGSPYFALQISTASTKFWHYASLTDLHSTDGTNHKTITPAGSTASLSASIDINWTGGTLGGGVYVLNNGTDAPFQWAGTGLTDVYSTLSNWPAGMKANILRPFKQFLIAADIDEGSGRNGTLLRWSHPAIPGGVPSSWDYTDRTKDAGRVQISQTPDYIVEMEPLRDMMMLYKENNVWAMQFIGGNAKFSFRSVFDEFGILSRRCVVPLKGQHVVLTSDDLVIHNGNEVKSVIDTRWRTWLINNLDSDNYARSFVSIDHRNTEVWACIPQSGYTLPNIALVWNWQTNTITMRDLPGGTAHISKGIIDTGGDLTFDGDTGTFDAATGIFDEQADSGALRQLLFCDATNTKFYEGNSTETFGGVLMDCYIERLALPIGRQDMEGAISPDTTRKKYVTELWPVLEGTDGGVIDFYVGTRNSVHDGVNYSGPYPFTIGTTEKIDLRLQGNLVDIKVESHTDITWRLTSFALNVRMGGKR